MTNTSVHFLFQSVVNSSRQKIRAMLRSPTFYFRSSKDYNSLLLSIQEKIVFSYILSNFIAFYDRKASLERLDNRRFCLVLSHGWESVMDLEIRVIMACL